MGRPFYFDSVRENGLTYQQYFQRSIDDSVKILSEDSSEIEIHRHSMLKLNIQRMKRVEKTYTVSNELALEINTIKEKQLWLMISEPWCGDSAQVIPIAAKIASSNSLVELKIILRDEHSDIMDNYLSEDGKRSIPVLAVFDEDGEELFRWGSRPVEAEKLVTELKAQGLSKDEYLAKLHLWYAQNKGVEVEKEILSLLKNKTIAI